VSATLALRGVTVAVPDGAGLRTLLGGIDLTVARSKAGGEHFRFTLETRESIGVGSD